MFSNQLKSAWRNLWKRKEFSILNILGLSIGMAACLLILQYVSFELSYDTFHEDVSRIYRVNLGMTDPGDEKVGMRAPNHPAAGPALVQDFPQVESTVRLVSVKLFAGSSVLSYEADGEQIKTFYEEHMYIADSTFFSVFDFPLLQGDPLTVLTDPKQIVLTESLAKKYFGQDDPIGKTVSLNGNLQVTVGGIMKDLPEHTHMKINALFSFAVFDGNMDNTWIWPEFYTYIKLAPNTVAADLESQLPAFVDGYLGDIMEEFGITEIMALQPIQDIHLHSNYLQEITENGNYKTISFLVLIALMILVIAWINYINLATARSTERASEVGIRKVVGARKIHLISQFLMESALVNLSAIVLAVLMVQLFAPAFNQLAGKAIIDSKWALDLMTEGNTWGILAAVFLGGTLLAGLYPAFVLSSYQPVKTLKGKLYRSGKQLNFRHVMVAFQFAITLSLITGTLIVFNQLSFMRNQDLGFNLDQILVVKSPSIIDSTYQQKTQVFKDQVLQQRSIHHFTGSSEIPGHEIREVNSIKKANQPTDEAVFTHYIFTDPYFLDTYEIELIAGRNFSEEMGTDHETAILNEKAIELLGFQNPEDALGQQISRKLNQWDDVRIIGVVKNMNHRSLAYKQEPITFLNPQFNGTDYYSFQITTDQVDQTLAHIETVYNETFPGNPMEYFFLNEYFAKQYQADQRFGRIFGVFAGLAIIVACLGLLGLASFIAARRTKEIGIRKILGASPLQILFLLAQQFAILLLIAAVVAIPLIWWAGSEWLLQYAYRVELDVWVFAIPVLLVMAIALLTVLWQTFKVAHTDPSQALRYE